MSRMQLISSSTDFLELSWTKVPCIDHFILQIQLCPSGMDKSYSFEDIPHFSPSLVPIPSRAKPQPMPMYRNTSMPSSHNFNRHLPQMTKEIQSLCSPKTPYSSQSIKHNFQPSKKRPLNTTKHHSDSSTTPYNSLSSQVSFNYSPVPRNDYPSLHISQSAELPNSSQIEPPSAPKPAQTISLAPKEQSPTSLAPIVITIPPVFKEEQKFKQQTVYASPKTYSFVSPVMSKPNTSISYTTTSINKPIPSHIPVACAPVAPRTTLSASQTTPESSSPTSGKPGNNLFSSDLLPYLSSAISQLEGNKGSTYLLNVYYKIRDKRNNALTMFTNSILIFIA